MIVSILQDFFCLYTVLLRFSGKSVSLNNQGIISKVPFFFLVSLTLEGFSDIYMERILKFTASELETTRHLEFYLIWIETILTKHGDFINAPSLQPIFLMLCKNIQKKYDDLSKM